MGLKWLLNSFVSGQEKSPREKTKLSIEIFSNSNIQLVLKYILSFSKHHTYCVYLV